MVVDLLRRHLLLEAQWLGWHDGRRQVKSRDIKGGESCIAERFRVFCNRR